MNDLISANTNTNEALSFTSLPLSLTVADVGKVLGVGRNTAYDLVHSSGFPRILIGKRLVIPRDKLIAWIETNTVVEETEVQL